MIKTIQEDIEKFVTDFGDEIILDQDVRTMMPGIKKRFIQSQINLLQAQTDQWEGEKFEHPKNYVEAVSFEMTDIEIGFNQAISKLQDDNRELIK